MTSEEFRIDDDELTFTAARGGGPGGQHVNKTSSRVTLWFDVDASPSLSAEQKRLVRTHLRNRIGRDGRLRVVCGAERSQGANRARAIERFHDLLREALAAVEPRVETRVPRAERRRRLDRKRRRSGIKRERRRLTERHADGD